MVIVLQRSRNVYSKVGLYRLHTEREVVFVAMEIMPGQYQHAHGCDDLVRRPRRQSQLRDISILAADAQKRDHILQLATAGTKCELILRSGDAYILSKLGRCHPFRRKGNYELKLL